MIEAADKIYTIILRSINAPIEESAGRRRFKIDLKDAAIPEYQKKILIENICKRILSVQYIQEEDTLWIYYDFSGYVQLKDVFSRWRKQNKNIALETAEVISEALLCILDGENLLLGNEGFSLSADTVFVNPATGETRLAYVPGVSHSFGLQESVIELISDSIKLSEDDQWEAYGKEIIEEIKAGNFGLNETVKYLSEKMREINTGMWPDKNLSREIQDNVTEEPELKKQKQYFWNRKQKSD